MDKLMIKRWAIVIGIVIVNLIFHIGIAGLVATGVYMLNSFLGLAADAKPWQYGVCGMVYLVIQVPFLYLQLKDKLESFLKWGFLF